MQEFRKKVPTMLVISLILAVSALGIFGIILIDSASAITQDWGYNIMARIIDTLLLERINVTVALLFVFAIAYLATALPAMMLVASENRAPGARGKVFVRIASALILIFGWFLAIEFCIIKDIPIWKFFQTCLYFVVTVGCVLGCLFVAFITVYFLSLAFKPHIKTTEIGAVHEAKEVKKADKNAKKAKAESENNQQSGDIFPGLKIIDDKYGKMNTEIDKIVPSMYSLPQIAEGFQAYLSEKCELYYDLHMLRAFIAGMASSKLIILEGLSGTGKSSLPRYFSEYVGSKAFFAPVQATWRDRTDVLGFYNDFSYVFKETPFLKRLYEASYMPREFNLMVLDEMNLSRVEYYFADFLSVMEYPPEDWKIALMPALDPKSAPTKMDDGAVVVPINTWFVGTANKDDSTFTITDKVYDRAIVLEFNDRKSKVHTTASPEPIDLEPGQLMMMFQKALGNQMYCLTDVDKAKFDDLSDFVYDIFEITFGNRIMNQIATFVPVFVALGGTKEEAIDIIFCRKVLHKLEGRFEDYILEGLVRLQNKINELYGAGVFEETETTIRRLIKKLT